MRIVPLADSAVGCLENESLECLSDRVTYVSSSHMCCLYSSFLFRVVLSTSMSHISPSGRVVDMTSCEAGNASVFWKVVDGLEDALSSAGLKARKDDITSVVCPRYDEVCD